MVYCKYIRGTNLHFLEGCSFMTLFLLLYTIYSNPKNIRNIIHALIRIHEALSNVMNLFLLLPWTLNYQSKHDTLSDFSNFWPWPFQMFLLFYTHTSRMYCCSGHKFTTQFFVCQYGSKQTSQTSFKYITIWKGFNYKWKSSDKTIMYDY